jgi:hypothetical protein
VSKEDHQYRKEFLVRGWNEEEARERADEWLRQIYTYGMSIHAVDDNWSELLSQTIEFEGVAEIPVGDFTSLQKRLPVAIETVHPDR